MTKAPGAVDMPDQLEMLAIDCPKRRIRRPRRPDLDAFDWAPVLRARRAAEGAPPITGIVHTRNEERNLPDALRSLAWVDQVVVVDMESTDRTVSIAIESGCRVLRVPLTDYVEPARAAAVEAVDTNWILILDADERVEAGLAEELDAISRSDAADVVEIFRRTWIAGRFLSGSGWQGDWQIRFFKRGHLEFSPRIHSLPAASGRRHRIEDTARAALVHFNYDDLAHFVDKLNRYTDIEAEALVGGPPMTWPALTQLMRAEFATRWTPDSDGSLSAALAFSMLYYRFISQAKHWQSLGYPPVGLPDDWQTALKDLAHDGRALHQAALAAADEGNIEGAAQLLHRAVQAQLDVEALNDLAVLRSRQGRNDEAHSLLRTCVLLDPGYDAARRNLAALEGPSG